MATLTENIEHFWLDLINWSNKEKYTPTRRWNLFQRWLLHDDDFHNIFICNKTRYAPDGVKKLRDKYPSISDDEKTEIQERIDKFSEQIKQLSYAHDLPINIDFVRNLRDVDFSDAEFLAPVNFYETIFQGSTNFSHAKFHYNVEFTEASFECPAEFEHVKFKGDAVFNGTVFEDNAYFNDAVFRKMASFLPLDAYKVLDHYNENIQTRGVHFQLNAEFKKAKFIGCSDFRLSKFEATANFEGARFKHDGKFNYAEFKSEALFNGTRFYKEADFHEVTFTEKADFKVAFFYHDVFFIKAKFTEFANFTQATFKKNSYFTNIEKVAQLNFDRAEFKKHPPKTFETTLDEASFFVGIVWPDADKNSVRDHIKAYERLRIQASNLGMVEIRNIIVRKEFECRAIVAEGIDKLLRNAYGHISNHGTSVGRPLFCLFGLFFISYLFWGIHFFQFPIKYSEVNHFDLFLFNLSKTIPILNMDTLYTNKDMNETLSAAPFYLKIPSVLLSVASPIFLFLAGLGLRSKFRMSL